MSYKINENKDLVKLREEILKQMRIEQAKFAQNLEEKMEETARLINDSNKKFEENKLFFENILSQKYYFEKLDSLDKIAAKLNDSLIAHEIRISKNIDDINNLRTKYDKIILDNLLLPGHIGPSCQHKNLSQYIKNNIYDMTRMKQDNENMKNLSKDLKIKVDIAAKNVSDLIDNTVTRSNQYTDSRISDCYSFLDNKTKEMNEKIMDIRMKFIQRQDKLEEDIKLMKQNFEEKLKMRDEKINELNLILADINENLPDEENILNNIEKLKQKIKNVKNALINFINNYQPPTNNNNNNNQLLARNRRNSMIIGSEIFDLLRNSSDQDLESIRKNGGNDSKLNDLTVAKNKDRARELLSPVKRQRQSTSNFANLKYKSNQKSNNIKMKLINISETSSDNNDNDNNDKNANKKSKNNHNKKKFNEINEQNNNNSITNNFNESKKNKNKSNRSNRLDKGNKNKSTNRNKNNKNTSKSIKKDNSNLNSFDSITDSDDSNYYKEKDKATETKNKSIYHNKKNNERIVIQTRTLNHFEKNLTPFTNTSQNSYNNFPSLNIDPNNFPNNRFNKNYQSFSRNFNASNNNIISNNLYSNLNPQQMNFYRTQQEEKKEIIKDFFSKYDKRAIPENLSLIKNRGNLDLYNYSVSPPDNRHFLDTKQDEIYNPPLSKEFLINKKNNSNSKIGSLSRGKHNTINYKLNLGNSIEMNNKKVGTSDYNDKKIYLNSNNNITNNNKFMKNKKLEFSNKFSINNYKNYHPENIKKEKKYSMNSSKKI